MKTPHKWTRSECGYDCSSTCDHCGANNYQSFGTETCEDYKEALVVNQQKASRTHVPTEAAWTKLRSILTKEEWDLLELREKHSREYRERDYIRIGK